MGGQGAGGHQGLEAAPVSTVTDLVQNLFFCLVNPHLRLCFPLTFRKSGWDGERQRGKHRCERLVTSHSYRLGWGLSL